MREVTGNYDEMPSAFRVIVAFVVIIVVISLGAAIANKEKNEGISIESRQDK